MKQLTNEEIARVFLMYWQQSFVYSGSIGTVRTIAGLNKGWNILDDLSNDSYRADKCKLLLTPLSSITDEHAFEVSTRTDYNRKYDVEHPDFNVKILEDRGFTIGNTSNSASFFWHSLHWRQYEYLKSKGYAVPLWFELDHWANGKTAIELGIAIDATSTKSTSE